VPRSTPSYETLPSATPVMNGRRSTPPSVAAILPLSTVAAMPPPPTVAPAVSDPGCAATLMPVTGRSPWSVRIVARPSALSAGRSSTHEKSGGPDDSPPGPRTSTTASLPVASTSSSPPMPNAP
jgi:hypothetical protein